MGGQIITYFIGQCGNQIGQACWELYCLEHCIAPDGRYFDDSIPDNFSSYNFFLESHDGKFVPRSIMIDLEPNVIDEIKVGPYRNLFNPDNMINSCEDAANNFARGFYSCGREIVKDVVRSTRKVVEACDDVQAFIVHHSFGGGTGSGFMSMLLEYLSVEYSKRTKLEFGVFPSPAMSMAVVEPYNTVLALHTPMENADVAAFFENESLFRICDRNLLVDAPTFTHLNRMAAQVISGMTASLRFEGPINTNLIDFQTNLVPYPRIHFPLVSFAPFISPTKISHDSCTTKEITVSANLKENQMADVDPLDGAYMSCCMLYRGDVNIREVNSIIAYLKNNRNMRWVDWCPTGYKVGINYQPMIAIPNSGMGFSARSLTLLCNSTAIKRVIGRINHKFMLLFERKSFIHWYVSEGMEESEFKEAFDDVMMLEKDFEVLEETAGDRPSPINTGAKSTVKSQKSNATQKSGSKSTARKLTDSSEEDETETETETEFEETDMTETGATTENSSNVRMPVRSSLVSSPYNGAARHNQPRLITTDPSLDFSNNYSLDIIPNMEVTTNSTENQHQRNSQKSKDIGGFCTPVQDNISSYSDLEANLEDDCYDDRLLHTSQENITEPIKPLRKSLSALNIYKKRQHPHTVTSEVQQVYLSYDSCDNSLDLRHDPASGISSINETQTSISHKRKQCHTQESLISQSRCNVEFCHFPPVHCQRPLNSKFNKSRHTSSTSIQAFIDDQDVYLNSSIPETKSHSKSMQKISNLKHRPNIVSKSVEFTTNVKSDENHKFSSNFDSYTTKNDFQTSTNVNDYHNLINHQTYASQYFCKSNTVNTSPINVTNTNFDMKPTKPYNSIYSASQSIDCNKPPLKLFPRKLSSSFSDVFPNSRPGSCTDSERSNLSRNTVYKSNFKNIINLIQPLKLAKTIEETVNQSASTREPLQFEKEKCKFLINSLDNLQFPNEYRELQPDQFHTVNAMDKQKGVIECFTQHFSANDYIIQESCSSNNSVTSYYKSPDFKPQLIIPTAYAQNTLNDQKPRTGGKARSTCQFQISTNNQVNINRIQNFIDQNPSVVESKVHQLVNKNNNFQLHKTSKEINLKPISKDQKYLIRNIFPSNNNIVPITPLLKNNFYYEKRPNSPITDKSKCSKSFLNCKRKGFLYKSQKVINGLVNEKLSQLRNFHRHPRTNSLPLNSHIKVDKKLYANQKVNPDFNDPKILLNGCRNISPSNFMSVKINME